MCIHWGCYNYFSSLVSCWFSVYANRIYIIKDTLWVRTGLNTSPGIYPMTTVLSHTGTPRFLNFWRKNLFLPCSGDWISVYSVYPRDSMMILRWRGRHCMYSTCVDGQWFDSHKSPLYVRYTTHYYWTIVWVIKDWLTSYNQVCDCRRHVVETICQKTESQTSHN